MVIYRVAVVKAIVGVPFEMEAYGRILKRWAVMWRASGQKAGGKWE